MDSGMVPGWLNDNWFTILQSLGIAGSLVFTGLALQRDNRARRVSEHLRLSSHHRRLWGEVYRNPQLARMLRLDRNAATDPATEREESFLLLVFVHFQTGWLLAREGSLTTLDALERDAGAFFALPIPGQVWDSMKSAHDPEFVRFIDEAVRRTAPAPAR